MALNTGNAFLDALGGTPWTDAHKSPYDGALVLTVYFDNEISEGHSVGGAWTPEERSAFWQALHSWSSVANIRFLETDRAEGADLLERKVNPSLNMFLTTKPGLESGFMIAHVTSAALASENKTLAHPASVDTIPTSAGQEDHVSMAAWAVHKLLQVCDNVELILAIEALAAARAIDAQAPLTPTPELQRVHACIRSHVAYDPSDHRLDREIATIARAIRAGALGALLPRRERTAIV